MEEEQLHHHHHHHHSHNEKLDDAERIKRGLLSSRRFRKRAFSVLFLLMSILAVLVVMACVYAYVIDI